MAMIAVLIDVLLRRGKYLLNKLAIIEDQRFSETHRPAWPIEPLAILPNHAKDRHRLDQDLTKRNAFGNELLISNTCRFSRLAKASQHLISVLPRNC
jgi:hypothetical protein